MVVHHMILAPSKDSFPKIHLKMLKLVELVVIISAQKYESSPAKSFWVSSDSILNRFMTKKLSKIWILKMRFLCSCSYSVIKCQRLVKFTYVQYKNSRTANNNKQRANSLNSFRFLQLSIFFSLLIQKILLRRPISCSVVVFLYLFSSFCRNCCCCNMLVVAGCASALSVHADFVYKIESNEISSSKMMCRAKPTCVFSDGSHCRAIVNMFLRGSKYFACS